jgi:hypothetical protein
LELLDSTQGDALALAAEAVPEAAVLKIAPRAKMKKGATKARETMANPMLSLPRRSLRETLAA